MARKTNKTAHVLNLISKAKDEHQAMEEQMQIDNTGSDVSDDLLFMGIEPSNDKSISEKINENLESLAENEGELPSKEPENVEPKQMPKEEEPKLTTSVKTTLTATDNAEKNKEETMKAEPTETTQVPTEPTQAPTEPAQTPTEPTQAPTEPAQTPTEARKESASTVEISENPAVKTPPAHTFHYVNVYENLVNERLQEFQTMFDVCTCQRCTADVAALALTNLPSKYIVTDNAKTVPLLSFYRERFKTSVAAQLSSACIVVKNNPYHS